MKLSFFVAASLIAICTGAVDVEKTVQQVESILKTNSLLPRLTREEILQLLNDIRAEDEKSKVLLDDFKKVDEIKKVSKNKESNSVTQDINVTKNIPQGLTTTESTLTNIVESTTKSGTTKLTVVLPYTPRDGSSLQELYTRPPRVEIVPEQKVTKKPTQSQKPKDNTKLSSNAKTNKLEYDFPAELQAFLNSHGLKGNPGQDNFLLPLDGFKPLPPAKVIDESVELPESILLAYDLISPSDSKPATSNKGVQQTNFLYDPLPPEYPFELDTSASQIRDSVLPYDLPKPRKTKSFTSTPNYDPIDYDSVRVIPLNKGPNPLDEVKVISDIEQNKRQTNVSVSNEDASNITITTEEPTTAANDLRESVLAVDNDQGASISDLEDSFGGAAPEVPGDSVLPPPRKNGFYWMLDWNSFLEVGDGDSKVNIRFEPKLGDPQMFLPVNVP